MSKWFKFAVKILCGSIKLARPSQPLKKLKVYFVTLYTRQGKASQNQRKREVMRRPS